MFATKVDDEIKLALVQPSFAPAYLRLVSSQVEYLSRWLAWPVHATSEDFFKAFIRKSLHEYADGQSLTCAMFYHDTLVGNVSLNAIRRDLSKVSVGYWLSEDCQGKGIVTRSASKLIDYAFGELGLDKVQISAAVDNWPSRKVCDRLSMHLEGVITNSENVNGRIMNHAVYGLRRDAWCAR